MKALVSELHSSDRSDWEELYRAYADFYQVPMNQEILDTVWSWIFDEQNPFDAMIAKGPSGDCLGFMHFRAMPSPLRGKLVGFLDDLFIKPENRGSGVYDKIADKTQWLTYQLPIESWRGSQ